LSRLSLVGLRLRRIRLVRIGLVLIALTLVALSRIVLNLAIFDLIGLRLDADDTRKKYEKSCQACYQSKFQNWPPPLRENIGTDNAGGGPFEKSLHVEHFHKLTEAIASIWRRVRWPGSTKVVVFGQLKTVAAFWSIRPRSGGRFILWQNLND
jgi:hypothetical protein